MLDEKEGGELEDDDEMVSDEEIDYLEGAVELEDVDGAGDDPNESLAAFKELVLGVLESNELDKKRASKMEIVDFM